MDLRTTFSISESERKIDYSTPVFFAGSCFASDIGSRMADGKMDVMINPAGTVYNPVSIMNTLDLVISGRNLEGGDLYLYNGSYVSFLHYTSFSSESEADILTRINSSTERARSFLSGAGFMFVTFGTARIYSFKETGKIVSNCHKLPREMFTSGLLTPENIVSDWLGFLDRLHEFNRNIRVVFTISPVRHWKDGAHGNQVSKSTLFLAVEALLSHPAVAGYFPAYEIIMDDLRDYRYYAEDMLHPSKTAIEYVWKAFSAAYIDPSALKLWKEAEAITRAVKHRLISDKAAERKKFAAAMLSKIDSLQSKNPKIDLSSERLYFSGLSAGK